MVVTPLGVDRREGEVPLTPQDVLPQNSGRMNPKYTVICMILKVNDRRNLARCQDEVRGYRSYSVDWMTLEPEIAFCKE
ncbi:hypothetical protein TNCV_4333461 [Trichonephila clavipes]|nr:hypothetical protein TNCV_4333461 [Trichonephila clavipes]